IPKHVGLCVAYSTGVPEDFAIGMVARRGRIGSRWTQKPGPLVQELATTKCVGPTIRLTNWSAG
ncbi:unnamed protein product, partial [Ectocarpus sp. 6 AP-2014]